MPITEMIVSVSIATGIVLIIATLARAASLRSLHRTVTAAIESNSPEASALIERLGRRPRVSVRLIAYVLLAIAPAILGFGGMEGDLGDLRGAASAAMFPGFVAVALLLYLRAVDRAPDRVGDA